MSSSASLDLPLPSPSPKFAPPPPSSHPPLLVLPSPTPESASNTASRGSGSGRKKNKRNRVHSSCEACRLAKQRCSREVLCVNCKLRGRECVYINAEPLPSSSDDPSADEVALLNQQLRLAHLEIDRLRDQVTALQQRLYDPPAGMLASHLGQAQEDEGEGKSLPSTPTSPTFFPGPSIALPPAPNSYTFPFPSTHHAGLFDLPLLASPHPPRPPPTSLDFLPLPFPPPPPPILPSPAARSYSLHQPLQHSLAAFSGPAPPPSVQVQVQVHRSASLPSPSFGGGEGELVPFPLPLTSSSSVPAQLGGGGRVHPFEQAAFEGGSGRGRGRVRSWP